MNMQTKIEKSSQDWLGKFLSVWRNRRVIREIIPPLLDIGCGDNRIAGQIAGGLGIDIINYGKADVIVKDFNVLPFRTETFKTVTIVGSLNYFDNPRAVLFECERVLVPGGNLILTILDPSIGKAWHLLREPWAKYPGFSFQQIFDFASDTRFKLKKKAKFMLGLNNLYIFIKK